MDSHYQQVYRQAAALQHNFHDYTHTMSHDPTTKVLQQQIHGLTHDLATNRRPQDIANRLSMIKTQLGRAQMSSPLGGAHNQGAILNNTQKNFLHSNFERMRQNISQHPNFGK